MFTLRPNLFAGLTRVEFRGGRMWVPYKELGLPPYLTMAACRQIASVLSPGADTRHLRLRYLKPIRGPYHD